MNVVWIPSLKKNTLIYLILFMRKPEASGTDFIFILKYLSYIYNVSIIVLHAVVHSLLLLVPARNNPHW